MKSSLVGVNHENNFTKILYRHKSDNQNVLRQWLFMKKNTETMKKIQVQLPDTNEFSSATAFELMDSFFAVFISGDKLL